MLWKHLCFHVTQYKNKNVTCEVAVFLWTGDLERVCSFPYTMYAIIGNKFKIDFSFNLIVSYILLYNKQNQV